MQWQGIGWTGIYLGLNAATPVITLSLIQHNTQWRLYTLRMAFVLCVKELNLGQHLLSISITTENPRIFPAELSFPSNNRRGEPAHQCGKASFQIWACLLCRSSWTEPAPQLEAKRRRFRWARTEPPPSEEKKWPFRLKKPAQVPRILLDGPEDETESTSFIYGNEWG